MTITTSRPINSSGIAGEVSPSLSRSNQPGAETAAKISIRIASAEATGRMPRLQRITRNAKRM